MKSRRLEIGILAVAVIAIGVMAYANQVAVAPRPASVPSTFDTGRNGYRALFEVLHAAGVPVSRFGHVLALLDPGVRTLIVTGYEDEAGAIPLDAQDVAALQRFVRGGGRLIEIDTQFAGKNDIAPSVGTSQKAGQSNGAIAIALVAETQGVESVAGPIDSVFGFGSSVGVPLLANASGVVATRSRYGKGDVVAVTAPSLFANANLDRGQNATFAYDLVAGHAPVAFDDYVHGYDDDACDDGYLFGLDCLYRAMPRPVQIATWIVVAIVVFALIGANVPFAPPVPLEPPDERDTSAYLASMGALMRRARAGAAAIAAFAADARRRTRARGSRSAIDAAAELDRLATIPHPMEAAVLRAARLDFELRKEIK
jgi:hypothetical protein